MKLTLPLCKQHLERMARRHWFIQGKKKVNVSKAADYVAAQGVEIVDAVQEFMVPPKPKIDFDLRTVDERPLPKNEAHPDYKPDPCYVYGNTNVLVGGLKQAQILTNSIMAEHSLPQGLLKTAESLKISNQTHEDLQKQILLSCVYDTEQLKLPKKKDPLRPAWNFPRELGITNARKNELICRHLARTCEQILKSTDTSLVENVDFTLPLDAHGKSMQLDLNAELLLTSVSPLPPATGSKTSAELPDISPLHCTVSVEPTHFYEKIDSYPLDVNSRWPYSHTAFLHFDKTQIANLYDVPVNADQMVGRLLMKSFCIAGCQARSLWKEGTPTSPVTVQTIQTDGHFFWYMVYQLNTLDVEGSVRNVFWTSAPEPLYTNCSYVSGRPNLDGYNPAVLKNVLALMSNR